MSESIIEQAGKIAEELKSEKTFDARKAITGATYPEDSIEVYADAGLAHKLNIAANEAAKTRHYADTIYNGALAEAKLHATIEDNPEEDAKLTPGWAEAEAEAVEFEAEVADLMKGLKSSVLTFHLRGLAPKQWELIDKMARKEVKAPARKNFPQDEDGEEEFERVTHERNIDRNRWVNNALIAPAIVKVVNAEGESDTGVWKVEDVANLKDAYMESEFDKLKNLMQQLTFANNIFQTAVQQDADFLSKP